MSFGFQTYWADGTSQINSDTIGVLYIDDFDLASGSTTRYYPGLAGTSLTVVAMGNNTMAPNATITQGDSGGDRAVTVSVTRPGRFRVMVE